MTLLKVPFCGACGKVKDEIGYPPFLGTWIDLRTYRMKYGFRFSDLCLTQTFCSECAAFYRVVGGEERGINPFPGQR